MNKHNLPRDIPEPTKRLVRQACGNGCVICGILPYHYDHFDPEYADAKTHDENQIALLCPNHHAEKQRLGTREIAAARRKPFNATSDARWKVPVGREGMRTLNICTNRLHNAHHPGLVVNGETLFALHRDRSDNWLLTAAFVDDAGNGLLRVVDNEAVITRGVWDVTLEGPYLTIRTGKGKIALRLGVHGDRDEVELETFACQFANGCRLEGDSDGLHLSGPGITPTNICGQTVDYCSPPDEDPYSFDKPYGIAVDIPAMGVWSDWVTK